MATLQRCKNNSLITYQNKRIYEKQHIIHGKYIKIRSFILQASKLPQSIALYCLGNTLSLITFAMALASFALQCDSKIATQHLEALSQRLYLFMERKANNTYGNSRKEICISPVYISLVESGFPVSQTALHLTSDLYFWQQFLHFKPSSKNVHSL